MILNTLDGVIADIEVLSAAEDRLRRAASEEGDQPIRAARAKSIDHLHRFLSKKGFPSRRQYKRLSIIRYVFQEVLYDGLEWQRKDAFFEHLTPYFRIDSLVWSHGTPREKMTDEQFAKYIQDLPL